MRTGLIATFLGALALTACGSIGDSVWQKPIDLSPRVQAAFDAYTKLPAPAEFAVSEDGQHYGYSYCSEVSGSGCRGKARFIAIQNCESRSGVECKTYAIGTSPVFSGRSGQALLPE